MANWDRNHDYGNRGGHDGGGFFDRAGNALRRAFQGQDVHDTGMNRGGGRNYTSGANAWTDGAWTADAADRLDRDVDLGGNRGSDTSPFHAGWYGPQGRNTGGGMGRGYDAGYMGGGMNRGGMDRGGLGREQGWNLGTGDQDWGHNWGSGRMGQGAGNGYMGTGMDRGRAMGHDRGGGWMDRAQNAVRRGWEHVDDAFDRDDRPMGRGYNRDFGGRGMMGGSGMTGRMRYGGDMDRGQRPSGRGRMDYDNGYQGSMGANGIGNEPYYGSMNGDRYDQGYRGYGRDRDRF